MADTYYTIGMAGHIDHGKTTLTKALTNVDTDRLKEEKERNISIESGYAPLQTEDGTHVSIVDVPGHERFIRQMIAGVAGIDLIVLVIAADEGVMPQTKEHLEIAQFLGIEHAIVAISKVDSVDDEMLELVTEDIRKELVNTVFKDAPYVYVDGLSGRGVEKLKDTILIELKKVTLRDEYGPFRLPIDQVFTVQGQGTIVRGTIYEGMVEKGSRLTILPEGIRVKARQIQVHHQDQEQSRAGQRTAINLGGVNREDIKRGDVLVASDHFLVTDTIDVALTLVDDMASPLKQRSPVKVHVGTSEVMGRIVFFDRNVVKQTNDEVLCQIRLEKEVVVRRGDRFVLRRPTPVETLGGGWIIQPNGGKYRFGQKTVEMLQKTKESTPEDLIRNALMEFMLLNKKQLIQYTSLDKHVLEDTIAKEIERGNLNKILGNRISTTKTVKKIATKIKDMLKHYHESFPMRPGIKKAELVQQVSTMYPKSLVEHCLEIYVEQDVLIKKGQFVALHSFHPHLPAKWKSRMEEVIDRLKKDRLNVKKWEDYFTDTPITEADATDLAAYLIYSEKAYQITDDMLIHYIAFDEGITRLKDQTGESFGLKEAKEALNVSRKYLIPFLELLDQRQITYRVRDKRKWKHGGSQDEK